MSGQRPFDLGGWRVDPLQGTLSNGDKTARLEPRLMDLLLLFAASPGRVIAKAEIVAAVWGGRAIGDDTLAGAISRLRSALGETAHERFIVTLPKRGYRLVVSPDASPSRPISDANDDVSDLLRKGRAALNVPLPQSLAQARIYFRLRLPPSTSAEAHAAPSDAHPHQVGQGAACVCRQSIGAGCDRARSDLAIAWALRGTATLMADRDFAAAVRLSQGLAQRPIWRLPCGRCFAWPLLDVSSSRTRNAPRH
jgi:DNA-binding winged helix-turn-helix (wHTH) protein